MLWLLPILFCFNPHSCTRSDVECTGIVLFLFCFNPHSCTRSDSLQRNLHHLYTGFNPHSCTRSDIDTCLYVLLTLVSIHTPVQGVTSLQVVCFTFQKFQSTLLYKEWPSIGILIIRHLTFQSTLLYKEWPIHSVILTISIMFQSTLLYKEWLFW